MRIVGKVVDGRPVTEVNVNQNAHLLKMLQSAVNRAHRNIRVHFLHVNGEVLGGRVITSGHQRVQHGSAGSRYAPTCLAEFLKYAGGPWVLVHPMLFDL